MVSVCQCVSLAKPASARGAQIAIPPSILSERKTHFPHRHRSWTRLPFPAPSSSRHIVATVPTRWSALVALAATG